MQREFLLRKKCRNNPVGIRQHAESRSSRIDALRQKYLPVLLHRVQQIDGVLQSQMTPERSQVSIDLQLDVQHFAIFEVDYLKGGPADFDQTKITRLEATVDKLEILKICRLELTVFENAMFVFARDELTLFLEFLIDDIRLLHAANYHFFPILLLLKSSHEKTIPSTRS